MVMRPAMVAGPWELSLRSERPLQLIDVTGDVDERVRGSGVQDGLANVFCPHTSAGLAVTELEDGLHADVERVMEQLAPVAASWAHDDLVRRYQNLEPDERPNGWSHVRALLFCQPSLSVPVTGGRLALGTWQRLFFVELDGPRDRRARVQLWGTGAAGPG